MHIRLPARVEFWALLLIVLTLAVLAWERIGMQRLLTLEPGYGGRVWVEGDQDVGGNSKARLEVGDAWTLSCEVVPDVDYPHCRLLVALSATPDGVVDLRDFDELRITLSVDGNDERPVPIHLNHLYSDDDPRGERVGYKVHQQLVYGNAREQRFVVPLGEFVVPAWFAFYNDLSLDEYLPDFSRVAHFSIESSSGRTARLETLRLTRLEFAGKWVDRETLLQALLWFWLMLLLVFLSYRGYVLNRLMLQRVREKTELEQLNRILDVRSKEMETLAKHDPLTGLLNRAGMHEALSACIEAAQRGAPSFAVLLLDLDRFKHINDTLGHAAGDRALKAVAGILLSRCRGRDSVSRWGGEEFLILCPETQAEAAAVLGQALCDEVRTTAILDGMQITCSVGVSAFDSEDVDSLFSRVDQALYQAKADGRNRVVSAG